MPTNPQIALSVRPAQIDNPVEKILTLRNLAAQQQNQQLQAQQQQELHAQQIEQNKITLAGQQRQQSGVDAMAAAIKESLETDPVTGLQHPNYAKASSSLMAKGFTVEADHLTESATKTEASRQGYRDLLSKAQAAAKEHLGEIAQDATRMVASGQPPPVIKAGIIGRVAVAAGDGLISEDQAHQFIAQVGEASPEQLTAVFDQFLTPTIREREGKMAKQTADLTKTQADTAKVQAELTGTLPETPAQASTRHLAEARLKIAQRADARAEKAANPFGTTASGQPAQGPSGADFLKTLPAATANEVKAYAEGKRPFPTGMSYAKLQPLIALVSQYDPTFDASNYNARNKTRSDLVSPNGTGGKTIGALNTAIQHAGRLSDLIETLDNTEYPLANAVANPIKTALGSTKVTNFKAVAPQLMKEIERVWRGAGGSAGEIKELEESIAGNNGKQQQREALYNFVELAKGKLDTTETQRDNAMGAGGKDIPILFEQNKSIVERITARGGPKKTGEAAASSFAVGQTVQVGNKRVKITALHPDGTFDGDEVK